MYEITITLGDITKVDCDAIVNAAHPTLLGKGGVDAAIHKAAGPELTNECRKLHGCEVGKAKITAAYKLPAKYVIHTPGPKWLGGQNHERELLASCYQSSLLLANEYDCDRIAFPSISTGQYQFPVDAAAEIAISTIFDHCIHYSRPNFIQIVCFDQNTFDYYQAVLKIQLIERLIWLGTPSNWKKARQRSESLFIGLSNSLALSMTKWEGLGKYSDFIDLSGRAIDNNISQADSLDLNTCIATLICIHREQHWNGGWSDVISPRVLDGGIKKLAERLRDLA